MDLSLHSQPRLPLVDHDLRGDNCPQEHAVAHPVVAVGDVRNSRDQIEREEQYLERIFGEEYLTYKTSVRRWV